MINQFPIKTCVLIITCNKYTVHTLSYITDLDAIQRQKVNLMQTISSVNKFKILDF